MHLDQQSIYQENLKDKIILSPWEKYAKYNKFPYKFVINLLQVSLLTLLILKIDSTGNNFQRNQIQSFNSIFYDITDNSNEVYFRTIPALQEHLKKLFSSLRNMENLLIPKFDNSSTTYSIKVQCVFPKSNYEDEKNTINIFPITLDKNFKKPFNLSDFNSLKGFLQEVQIMYITIDNLVLIFF